jgi:NADH:ubiquinone oxidoreductase subunit 4 (subunit M)
MTTDTSDYAIWFVLFELSVITGLTALTLEGRSYRRLYALLVMLACTAISAAIFYLTLHNSRESLSGSWLISALATLIIIVKTPAFPFSVWLPEAHVEASWAGSIVLAAFALKFSTLALVLFSLQLLIRLDTLATILIFSVVLASVAMASVIDVKKLIANFSIVHMSATVFLLTSPLGSDWHLNFSWHHHSVVTSWIFLVIGWLYASSSSRLIRLLVRSSNSIPLSLLLVLALFTCSLDLPWTSNVLVELQVMRLFSDSFFVIPLFFLFFWALVLAYVALNNSKLSKNQNDMTADTASLLLSSVAILIPLGFATRPCYFLVYVLCNKLLYT